MSVAINKKGDLIITIKTNKHFKASEEIELRRTAVYEALVEHDNKEFIGSNLHYGLTEILKDLDLTPEQWKKVLNNPDI